LSHGTCSYIRMYINAVANSVMLCLWHDFYNIIFKIRQIIRSLRVNPPPPQRKIVAASPFPLFLHTIPVTRPHMPLTRLAVTNCWKHSERWSCARAPICDDYSFVTSCYTAPYNKLQDEQTIAACVVGCDTQPVSGQYQGPAAESFWASSTYRAVTVNTESNVLTATLRSSGIWHHVVC
jgi:hypothetical protein